MRAVRVFVIALTLLIGTAFSNAAAQDQPDLRTLIGQFVTADGYDGVNEVVAQIAATGEPEAARVLRVLEEGDLYYRKDDEAVFATTGRGRELTLLDPVTGEEVGEASKRDLTKIRVNNSVRRAVRDALGSLNLASDNASVRYRAATTLVQNPAPGALPIIDAAIDRETVGYVKARMQEARAASILFSDYDDEARGAAIDEVAALGTRNALGLLNRFANEAEGELAERAQGGIASIERRLQFYEIGQNVWYGISLGSVLLLAAIGLAITFGVMGVINMAHGEMVMLGAYTTFVVQDFMRGSAPELLPYALPIALPLAFLVSGSVGFALERGVIRFLYGRPLETLLATWGVSLILQQAVRSIFGPTNREVSNPDWMSGAFRIGEMSITYNRLYIVIFSIVVFAALLLILNRSSLGLKMRAVTQNRRMASAMGIRTPWVDAMTFALGSGIAGIAGVALSQIDNVSPNLGQSYIIDSFLVVVFGGVGNLWGTLIAAMSLGVVNKFLEPYAGAVLGKIAVLVFIILFIQKRPRGLFALKGRAVEA